VTPPDPRDIISVGHSHPQRHAIRACHTLHSLIRHSHTPLTSSVSYSLSPTFQHRTQTQSASPTGAAKQAVAQRWKRPQGKRQTRQDGAGRVARRRPKCAAADSIGAYSGGSRAIHQRRTCAEDCRYGEFECDDMATRVLTLGRQVRA
jgi:hypothetical protein